MYDQQQQLDSLISLDHQHSKNEQNSIPNFFGGLLSNLVSSMYVVEGAQSIIWRAYGCLACMLCIINSPKHLANFISSRPRSCLCCSFKPFPALRQLCFLDLQFPQFSIWPLPRCSLPAINSLRIQLRIFFSMKLSCRNYIWSVPLLLAIELEEASKYGILRTIVQRVFTENDLLTVF